jgi:hypothetical protein
MNTAAYVLGIAVPVLVIVVVLEQLRRGKMRERHAIWWLVFGALALVAGIFPALLETAAELVGVELPINLVFFVAISIAFLVFLQHSAELTQLEAKTRDLAERYALLEFEVRTMRQEGEPPEPGTPRS